MKKLQSYELRQLFLDFFEEKNHKIEKSASLIPVEDPSLLWINSGVATLKKYFDGTVKPENPRIASAQKSIRTNDIENVGKTARHHTLFEMLGNFSIGDYFKEEAIQWAWEFLTSENWMAIDPDKLYVTIYPKDQEARHIWGEVVGIENDHIIEEEGNFWDIGEGPSGPNTEIFYDRGSEYLDIEEDDPENYPGGENERWLEIWNLVFSQFNHKEDGTYEPLPSKNIDTGMGLERMLSIVQDAPTNYETDLFMPIIEKTENISGQSYDTSKEIKTSFKVIADHIRAISFAIGDGALPSNEGRGYILRRLLRRAVMHGRKLSIERPFLKDLVPVVADITRTHYPEIAEKTDFISKIVLNEEERFQETLEEGLAQLNTVIDKVKANNSSIIKGEDAFQLYDTFGFPIELTEEYAAESNLNIDFKGFERELEVQKERARSARSDEQSMAIQSDLMTQLTADTEFLGYESLESTGKIETIVDEDSFIEETGSNNKVQIIFDQTPFYAEKGGQIGDTGQIRSENGEVVGRVVDVKSAPAGQPMHQVDVIKPMKKNERYLLTVDSTRRLLIQRNHTATHLLHQALKDVIGDHANQAGSLVAQDHLRFDFTHFAQVTPEELEQMEKIVNQKIWNSITVNTVETTLEKAKNLGAVALFGEKYGDEVRAVMIDDYSKELCGGTHVPNTSDIGLFKIISESGIGAGTRRIVAKTSQGAYQWLKEQLSVLNESADELKAQTNELIPDKINQLQDQVKDLKRENESLLDKIANAQAENVFEDVEEVSGLSIISKQVQAKDMKQLRQLADKWKQNNYSDVLVLGLKQEDKGNLIVAMNNLAIEKGLKSGDLIKEIAPYIDGGGGGRPDMAQAGGKNPKGLDEALKEAKNWISNQGIN